MTETEKELLFFEFAKFKDRLLWGIDVLKAYMGFSDSIATVALVGCGRRCCVCHKFCGVKIELHHIVQPEDGGKNTLDNCIPLCFDCHADVKHYNDSHPKGRKIKSKELRDHRNNWYETVKKGYIPDNDIRFEKIVNQISSKTPKRFHLLDIDILLECLINWINYKMYRDIIKRVVLYSAPIADDFPIKIKYVLYFEMETITEEITESKMELDGILGLKIPLMDDRFKYVYKEKPKIRDYKDEWLLTTDKIDNVADDYSVMIYEKK